MEDLDKLKIKFRGLVKACACLAIAALFSVGTMCTEKGSLWNNVFGLSVLVMLIIAQLIMTKHWMRCYN